MIDADKRADRKAAKHQAEGTREFERAVGGKQPPVPETSHDRETDAELNDALEDTFPASDPVAPTAHSKAGAPEKRSQRGKTSGSDQT